MASTNFGKRSTVAAVAQPPARANPAAPTPGAMESYFLTSRIPYVSLSILALLALVFAVELNYATPESPGTPSVPTLVALGGIGRGLVFEHGQWWRIFTAPLLHGSLFHLLSNAVGLLLAGILLEPVIGRSWYAAIFFIGAVAGSIGSLASSSDAIVSIGASGAIMALLAAVIVWCIPFADRRRGRRLRSTAVTMFASALLPASGGHVDIGAHLGGAVAGGALGFLLLIFWPEPEQRPGHTQLAKGIAFAGIAASFAAFALVALFPTPDVGQNVTLSLIPPSELSGPVDNRVARSSEFVRLYPDDPQSYYFHAMHYLRLGEITEAQADLRMAQEKSQAPGIRDLPHFRATIRLALALTMSFQKRLDDAKAVLQPGDCEQAALPVDDTHAIYGQLQKAGICR